jgi:hypothetical protein
MPVEIKPIQLPADANAFINVWFDLYGSNPNWVAPLKFERRDFLNPNKNPYFKLANIQCFIAWKDGKAVGTISAQVDKGYQSVEANVGFFGFFDVAKKWGMEYHSEDFGQTLAVWGLGDGPYVYVPLLGPSTVRDGIGFGVDAFVTDPLAWYSRGKGAMGWVEWTYFGATYIAVKDSTMDPLDELKKSSLDYYAALRSSYRQIRAKEIRNGAPPLMEDFD